LDVDCPAGVGVVDGDAVAVVFAVRIFKAWFGMQSMLVAALNLS
jgi:hypothetical protein